MSDTSEEKTHAASDKKLKDARKKGTVPHSADLVKAVSACAGLGYLWVEAGSIQGKCREALMLTDKLLSEPFNIAVDLALGVLPELAFRVVGPLLGSVVICAMLTAVLANGGPVFSTEPMTPKFENIDPIKGLKRIASLRSLVELGKSLFKLVCLGAIFFLVVVGGWKTLVYLPVCGMGCFDFLFIEVKLLIEIACGAFLIVGLIDLLLQRWLFLRNMRMTESEMKREHKEQQGNPELKREHHRLRREQANEPPLGLHRATLILTGPKMLVGLRYVRGETGVPVLVCRGEGEAASRISDEARALRLSIVDDHGLVRELIRSAKLGSPIPMQYFEPVAKALLATGQV
ncbi:EscU/YscU/HrcU family type III secretion system export apparatus switch protein [Bradyrhizobium sp. CCGUVB4N]|uniref:EscU/YscU/HrcU family type III secretion system export apparatus switch protein n=1 Tax=Bradyrhizobium sp. CCGUVB4N TaxID=2949631 RepID=UPI0020B2534F|nr:EscU/YscU/HrcU family type III secretion system export apparatus switch protein [Bradyrhizobium sp. CCGUVB4N]MCP3380163.1 EscU/YscU/HrcU family type III secretion system export apparatus switch protein [Bradyrhizobium sp. CCGUVB4N]